MVKKVKMKERRSGLINYTGYVHICSPLSVCAARLEQDRHSSVISGSDIKKIGNWVVDICRYVCAILSLCAIICCHILVLQHNVHFLSF